MITTISPAFEFLRKHKKVEDETQALVLKKVRGRISQDELITIFENGISGQYGKLYSCDPQTLLGWVSQYEASKNSPKNYLQSGLLPISTTSREVIDWEKEANKCFSAFQNGVSEQYFHPCVYDRLMIDGKIPINSCQKYIEKGETIESSKQKVLKNVFTYYRQKGYTTIYFIG